MKKQRWKWTKKGYYKYCKMCGKKYHVHKTDTLVCSEKCFEEKYGLNYKYLFRDKVETEDTNVILEL